ncbi:hypothetical protein [Flavobacterium sp. CLA17]|uniref:hypothetical protein n=1 Tax=Flavobacterium sp. CLA17 TaxID=2724135 RepID=UPI00149305B3|nr:hypothetical protein [Flavobacterium sp. CLA17]QSB27831.1 hypothetical protein HAV12_003530 [Flavobacterium sp. CLA17]
MNFKGGTIIIGSLLWDKTPIRHKWRTLCLNEISTKTPVKVKIRYGRQSQSRQNTYSMIFSNHHSTEYGQAYVLGFKEIIKNARILESQAFALASAEGLWGDKPSLNKSWGTVGLLVNPNIDSKDKTGADIIKKRWAEIYQNYTNTFKSTKYCIDNETPVIDDNGFLKIDWTEEMNDYDFLIATPVVPNIKKVLTAKEIADVMKDNNYFEYFENNAANDITTFQDNEIRQSLGR